MNCFWCGEELREEHGGPIIPQMHRACALRQIIGPVGHVRKRCSCYGGTEEDDPTLSKRERALAAVFEFYRLNPPHDPGAAEYPLTYRLGDAGASITCRHCGLTSHNEQDVEQRYCGHCRLYHDDIWPPARAMWIKHPEPTR